MWSQESGIERICRSAWSNLAEEKDLQQRDDTPYVFPIRFSSYTPEDVQSRAQTTTIERTAFAQSLSSHSVGACPLFSVHSIAALLALVLLTLANTNCFDVCYEF